MHKLQVMLQVLLLEQLVKLLVEYILWWKDFSNVDDLWKAMINAFLIDFF